MTEDQTPGSGKWTSTQAYILSVICLLVGVAVGYLARGSASPQPSAVRAPAGAPAATAGAAAAPTAEQLRLAAEAEAGPLLAQLKSDPNNADLLYKIGNVYYDAQQFPESVKYYEQCLKINPKATDVRTDMATAYHFMGQSDRALQEYDAVLKLDGKHANALFNTGMVKWQDKQDMSGAIAAWKRLLETNPQYPQRDKVQNLIAQAEQHLSMQNGAKSGKGSAN
ncbi:MAG TPA: tetratricopeptide repeat protein [Candidatus Sulfotelmatobacter sp.]|nr:tetratricopeptide repeat protein [Candidatus Sulfotelmatobacter sp.]